VPLIPESVAVMVIGPPAATPLATPVLLTIVAIAVFEEDHAEFAVTLCVEPSEKCPVAVNASVLPTATLPGFGAIDMVCKVTPGSVFDGSGKPPLQADSTPASRNKTHPVQNNFSRRCRVARPSMIPPSMYLAGSICCRLISAHRCPKRKTMPAVSRKLFCWPFVPLENCVRRYSA
jgi:hypothetical protein